jgi:hypothetical protein
VRTSEKRKERLRHYGYVADTSAGTGGGVMLRSSHRLHYEAYDLYPLLKSQRVMFGWQWLCIWRRAHHAQRADYERSA